MKINLTNLNITDRKVNKTESSLLENLEDRSKRFRRNNRLEKTLSELEDLLGPAEQEVEHSDRPQKPVSFVVGCPRSGTTLLMQCIAVSGLLGYPSNLLSRFYYAPYIGSRIQQLLTDPAFDYKNELSDLRSSPTFDSQLGKTNSALDPHEFFHFWRRFLPSYDPRWLSSEEEEAVNLDGLSSGIAAMERALSSPMVYKAIIVQYNARILSRISDEVLIVYVQRHPFYTMQSIYEARIKFYDDATTWWSVKPREYEWLKEKSTYEQIAGQVFFTKKAIEAQLDSFSSGEILRVTYSDLCQNPKNVIERISSRYEEMGISLNQEELPVDSFTESKDVRVSDSVSRELIQAYESLSGDALNL